MTTSKMRAGADFPSLRLSKAGGGEIAVGGRGDGKWQMLVIYRGKHCPVCRCYLKGLDGLLEEFQQHNVEVTAVSADTQEKAETEVREEGWRFPVGYGLTPPQMKDLGLYVSDPRSPQETDRPFAEPGLFLVNPDGKAQIIDISNAPWSRPDLHAILGGVKMIQERNYPIRGNAL